ncbi:MAG: DUF5694 domain-containing protein [Bacteroidota bacterium]
MKRLAIIYSGLLLAVLLASMAKVTAQDDAIPVLNLGVFHMGYTNDAHRTEYDESTAENKRQITAVYTALAEFRPTVICLEVPLAKQEFLREAYAQYLLDPQKETPYAGNEIELLGFTTGQLAGTKKVYAIDHKLSYQYDLSELAEEVNATAFFQVFKQLQAQIAGYDQEGPLSDRLRQLNTPEAYDFLININADVLTYVNRPDDFTGADEAAKYYQRNLRMFANLNRIPLTKDDRVLIISGASHAAFFDPLLRRSPRYHVVDVSKYLP